MSEQKRHYIMYGTDYQNNNNKEIEAWMHYIANIRASFIKRD